MADREGIRDSIKLISPEWLARGVGEKFLYSIATVIDILIDQLDQGILSRLALSTRTSSSLPLIAADRVIDRGFQETDASFALRLSQALDTWRRAGIPHNTLTQVLAYMTPDVPIVRMIGNDSVWDTWAAGVWTKFYASPKNWVWDVPGVADVVPAQWFRSWVVIYGTGSPWTKAPAWGAPGRQWGAGNAWGLSATPSQVSDVRRIVGRWKRQDNAVQWIMWTTDDAGGDAMFDPSAAFGSASLPDGKWANWSKVVAGVQVRARSANARYWNGVI